MKKKTSDTIDSFTLSRRSLVLGVGGAGVFGVLTARLYYLQVIRAEDYRSLSDDNRFNYNMVIPVRGTIRDRNGEALAQNRQDYRLMLIPEQVKNLDETLDKISPILPISSQMRRRIKKDIRKNPRFIPVLVKDHLDWQSFAALNLKTPHLAGIVPEAGEGRAYPKDGVFSHVLGYVGKASPSDVARDDDRLLLQPTFRIGKTGVEAAVDKKLRGESGRLKVEVNAFGRIVREWPEAKDAAKPGADVFLTLDADLQRRAAALFEDDSGGAVVIDVITGELRTLLSMPSFDANMFVSGLSNADMRRLNSDEKRPQFNKVIGGGYPPASTFKMAVMLAGLETGLIGLSETVFCSGKTRLGNRTFHCWERKGHGAVAMQQALQVSCDSYFYELGQRVGIAKIADVARRLGLGQIYDIDIGGQTPGIVPDEVWKEREKGHSWRMGDTFNASIGQGFVLTTPLQLAVMAARLANAREAVMPTLIISDKISEFSKLDFDPLHLDVVRQAMWMVTEQPGGTAYRENGLGIQGVELAGKTGTGQVFGITKLERRGGVRKNKKLPWHLRDHSVFVGFAPFDSPRFASAVLVEHGGSGAKRAADISRKLMAYALRRDGLGAGIEPSETGPKASL